MEVVPHMGATQQARVLFSRSVEQSYAQFGLDPHDFSLDYKAFQWTKEELF